MLEIPLLICLQKHIRSNTQIRSNSQSIQHAECGSYQVGVTMGAEDRFSPSTDPSSYNGVSPNFSSILDLLLYYFSMLRWSWGDSSRAYICKSLMQNPLTLFLKIHLKNPESTYLVRGDCTLERGTFVMQVWNNILLGYSEPSLPQKSDLAMAAGCAGHLLTPLADRWNAVSRLQSTIEVPSLQGFQQSLVEMPPLPSLVCSAFCSICLSRSCGCRFWLWAVIM